MDSLVAPGRQPANVRTELQQALYAENGEIALHVSKDLVPGFIEEAWQAVNQGQDERARERLCAQQSAL